MSQDILQQKEGELNNLLITLFQKHGINCQCEEDKIVFPQQQMVAHCHLTDRTAQGQSTVMVIVTVVLETGVDQQIHESAAGFGSNLQEAIHTGFTTFIENVFHVWLAAFFTNQYDDQVERSVIKINNSPFELILGNAGFRGKPEQGFTFDWLDRFMHELETKKIPDGTHWIRLYWAQRENKEIICEILLDNEAEESLQTGTWRNKLPLQDSFYSVRLFMVLQNKTDIHRLAATVAWMAEEEDEVKINYLTQNGVSAEEALKAVTLIPIAFADAFLQSEYEIAVPEETTIMNEKEETFPLLLTQEPIYTEALQLATGMLESGRDMKKYGPIVYQSSTFDALNQVLNEGKDPKDYTYASVIYWPGYKR